MTTVVYDAFIRDLWWLLQAIRKETLAGGPIPEFKISEKDGVPSSATQRNMLRRMRLWRVLDTVPTEALRTENKTTDFNLKIEKTFYDLYSLIQNGLALEIPAQKLYKMIEDWYHPMTFNHPFDFETWKIMKGKMKPAKVIRRKTTSAEPYFRLPPGTKWDDLEIRFKDRFEIAVVVNGKAFKSAACTDLGFYRSRTKDQKPDKQWEFLHALAIIYVTSNQMKLTAPKTAIADLSTAFGSENSVMTVKKKLSQQLQSAFGIKTDPFDDYGSLGYYRTKFKLIAEPELRHDRLFEAGKGYDDERLYGDAAEESSENIA